MNNSLPHFTVLVTRPEPQGATLCQLIAANGGKALHFPTIAFAPPENVQAFQDAVAELGAQEWLIFISPQAVYASVPTIRRQWPVLPEQVKFAAIGAGTAKALQEAGYHVAVQPTENGSSEAVLALPAFQSIEQKKIAIIRGEGGREMLDTALAARGAEILPVIAYQRVLPQVDIAPYQTLFQKNKIDTIVCTSFEGARNLKTLLGDKSWPYVQNTPLLVVSDRIKTLAQNLDYRTIWVSRNASDNAVLEVLAKMRKKR